MILNVNSMAKDQLMKAYIVLDAIPFYMVLDAEYQSRVFVLLLFIQLYIWRQVKQIIQRQYISGYLFRGFKSKCKWNT